MERWIAKLNIVRFKRRLNRALGADERRAIEKMLADEEAKLRAIEAAAREGAPADEKE